MHYNLEIYFLFESEITEDTTLISLLSDYEQTLRARHQPATLTFQEMKILVT